MKQPLVSKKMNVSKLHPQLCKYLKFRSGYLIDLSLKKLKKCLEKKSPPVLEQILSQPKDRNIERTNGDVILNMPALNHYIKTTSRKEIFSYDD